MTRDFPQHTLAEVIDAARQHVKLTRSGREHVGPCPFCGGDDRFRILEGSAAVIVQCRQCKRPFADFMRLLFPDDDWRPDDGPTPPRDVKMEAVAKPLDLGDIHRVDAIEDPRHPIRRWAERKVGAAWTLDGMGLWWRWRRDGSGPDLLEPLLTPAEWDADPDPDPPFHAVERQHLTLDGRAAHVGPHGRDRWNEGKYSARLGLVGGGRPGETLHVVEGLGDALALAALVRCPVAYATGDVGRLARFGAWMARRWRRAEIWEDGDAAGRAGAARLAQALVARGMFVRRHAVADGSDPRERFRPHVAAMPRPRRRPAFDAPEPGAERLAADVLDAEPSPESPEPPAIPADPEPQEPTRAAFEARFPRLAGLSRWAGWTLGDAAPAPAPAAGPTCRQCGRPGRFAAPHRACDRCRGVGVHRCRRETTDAPTRPETRPGRRSGPGVPTAVLAVEVLDLGAPEPLAVDDVVVAPAADWWWEGPGPASRTDADRPLGMAPTRTRRRPSKPRGWTPAPPQRVRFAGGVRPSDRDDVLRATAP